MAEIVATLADLGRPAWMILMVLAFIVFWPMGPAII
jgi:hypothetical protein